MNVQELLDVTKNLIDEVDIDEQVDVIIESAINHAYTSILASVDDRTATGYLPIINGVATLPEDILSIIKVSPELNGKDKRVGNSIITDKTGILNVTYSPVREPLNFANLTEEPDLNPALHYALCLFGAHMYYTYRKKIQVADYYKRLFEQEKYSFEESIKEDNGCVTDWVVDVYYE